MDSTPPDESDVIDLTDIQLEEVPFLDLDFDLQDGDLEDDVHEVITNSFEPIDLPVSLTSALVLNHSFQNELRDFRQSLIHRLGRNRERQSELISADVKIVVGGKCKEVDIPFEVRGPSHPNALAVFRSPYFKDIRGFHPPTNTEAAKRRDRGLVNQALIEAPKPFTKPELDRLRELVREFGMKKLLQPLFREKESLISELEVLSVSGSSGEKNNADDERKIEMRDERIKCLNEKIADLSAGYDVPSLEDSQSLDWMSIAVQLNSCHSDTECMLKWLNDKHPHINRSPFTPEETDRIRHMVLTTSYDFDAVAAALSSPGRVRKGWQIATYFQSTLNHDIKKSGPLSKAEALLLEVVISHCRVGDFIPWHQVNSFITGRTMSQLKHYWTKKQAMKVGDPWTELEDQVLAIAVQKFGIPAWNKVANYVFGRTNRQCRERYALRLAINDRKIGFWTKEEDLAIIDAAEKHEFKWALVQKEIPHRNYRQIASRYALLMERMKNNAEFMPSAPENLPVTRSNAAMTLENLKRRLDTDDKVMHFLEESREKLKLAFEKRNSCRRSGPRGGLMAASVDQQICEIFSFYSMASNPKASKVCRGIQDQQIHVATKDAVTHLLLGRKLETRNPFTSVIERIFTTQVTTGLGDGTPPVFPPNRTTLRGLQGLLIQRDYLIKQLADAGITTDQIREQVPQTKEYERLSQIFKALFYWPALCSITDTPSAPEVPVRLPKDPKEIKKWKSERAVGLSRERDKQAQLLLSASGTSELAVCFDRVKKSPDSQKAIDDFMDVVIKDEPSDKQEVVKKKVPSKTPSSEKKKKRPAANNDEPPVEPERRSKRTRKQLIRE